MLMIILWFVIFFAWLVWAIGYPIYKKVTKDIFDWADYSIGLCSLAGILLIVNTLRHVIG